MIEDVPHFHLHVGVPQSWETLCFLVQLYFSLQCFWLLSLSPGSCKLCELCCHNYPEGFLFSARMWLLLLLRHRAVCAAYLRPGTLRVAARPFWGIISQMWLFPSDQIRNLQCLQLKSWQNHSTRSPNQTCKSSEPDEKLDCLSVFLVVGTEEKEDELCWQLAALWEK